MITLQRIFEIQQLMQAFSLRDLQTLSTMFQWSEQCKIRLDELILYLKMIPVFGQLERLNYFSAYQSVPQMRIIKRFERKLPKEFRIELRKLRLRNIGNGSSKGG